MKSLAVLALLLVLAGAAVAECKPEGTPQSDARLAERITHREVIKAPFPLGKQAEVRLFLQLDAKGGVECIDALKGNPLLVGPAMDSVRKWKFQPLTVQGAARKSHGVLVLQAKDFQR